MTLVQRLSALWRRAFPPQPTVPPCPPINDPSYVDWVARYHGNPLVRSCASQALLAVAKRAAEDARIRRIVAEELARRPENV